MDPGTLKLLTIWVEILMPDKWYVALPMVGVSTWSSFLNGKVS